MALAYISSIQVDQLTLILLIVSQMTGAYFGPRFVVKMPVRQIRMFMGIGLVLAAFSSLQANSGSFLQAVRRQA